MQWQVQGSVCQQRMFIQLGLAIVPGAVVSSIKGVASHS
jgi:hypothetical protein